MQHTGFEYLEQKKRAICEMTWTLFIRFSMFARTNVLDSVDKKLRLASFLLSFSTFLQIKKTANVIASNMLQKKA